MDKIQELKNIRASHLADIKDFQEGVEKFSLEIIEEMKNQYYSSEDIFNEWLEHMPKEEGQWLEHIKVDGKDIWGYIDWGEPLRGRTYTINEVVDYLFDRVTEKDLTEEEAWKFCHILMEKNIGSLIYDW